MNPLASLAIAFAIFTAGAASGALVKGWQYDSQALASEAAEKKAFIVALDGVNAISSKFQTSLDALDSKRVVMTKEIFNETTRIEYRCSVPESGRLLYNSAAAESAVTR